MSKAVEKFKLAGFFTLEHIRDGKVIHSERFDNLVMDEGINSALNVVFHAATQITTWYVGLFEGNYTPVGTESGSTWHTTCTECTAYDESARPEYVEAASSAKSITNSASKAVFTMNATKTVYGAFLCGLSTKGGDATPLFAAARFGSSRSVVATDILQISYTVNGA